METRGRRYSFRRAHRVQAHRVQAHRVQAHRVQAHRVQAHRVQAIFKFVFPGVDNIVVILEHILCFIGVRHDSNLIYKI